MGVALELRADLSNNQLGGPKNSSQVNLSILFSFVATSFLFCPQI
jgi:hypothetical protein